MKAVWTILGWWTAGAAATGAGMMMLFSAEVCSLCGAARGRSIRSPLVVALTSPSGLLVTEAGADEFVGVVMSIGSPGDGVDICIVGAMIGIVLTPIDSWGPSAKWFPSARSAAAAICPVDGEKKTRSVT